jgi:hypothetical protein
MSVIFTPLGDETAATTTAGAATDISGATFVRVQQWGEVDPTIVYLIEANETAVASWLMNPVQGTLEYIRKTPTQMLYANTTNVKFTPVKI